MSAHCSHTNWPESRCWKLDGLAPSSCAIIYAYDKRISPACPPRHDLLTASESLYTRCTAMSDPSPIRTIPNDYPKYHDLDPLLREIRLLRVVPTQPGSPAGKVACELFRTNLDDCPQFRALSYCWGDLTVTSPVNLTFYCSARINRCDAAELGNEEWRERLEEGQHRIEDFRVTTNLHGLLRALSLEDVTSFIWADMLCIYPDRHRTECCRNLRFEPRFCEGFGFASHCLSSYQHLPFTAPAAH